MAPGVQGYADAGGRCISVLILNCHVNHLVSTIMMDFPQEADKFHRLERKSVGDIL